ncbi:tetratricopeptide repeat protein [Marinobacterium sp. YM272]|uniref:tetratricopeptide repeat protein n=1 Tax=Marinobacterium sp. YM272 TaxID=3421654 RepID=UPI003D7FF583
MLDGKISKQESYSLYIQRARLNVEGGQYDDALQDLDKASELGLKEPLLFEYGNIAAAKAEPEKAIDLYTRFIGFKGHFPQAYQARARVYASLNEFDQAIADFKRSFEIQKSPHPGLFIEASELFLKSEQPNSQAALDLLDQGMETLGVQGQLQEKAIEIELSQGHNDVAITRLRSLGAERKFNPSWRIDLAELLMKSGKPDEARKELDRALNDLGTKKRNGFAEKLIARIDAMRDALDAKL